MARTWAEAFGGVCIVPIAGSVNRIFLATDRGAASAQALSAAAPRVPAHFGLADYAPRACAVDVAGDAQVLHDR
jgi:hypothetical protein